ncbi:MAG: hypothetical protein A2W03_14335 [Candidatus Aminicenantes bacterium RBG_16_63_16]|nr:MAG: hypothetical protein A2W03_14335 [Candidatus Aminicenantes bacterium RBG_16_63_16]
MNTRLIGVAVLSLAALGAGFGQTPGGPGGPQPGHFYNLDTERQVEGVIQEVMFEPLYENRAPFLVVVLEENKTGVIYRVEVSPAWFFNYDFHKGEPAKVTGSFYSKDASSCLIARKLQAGGETFLLRDSRGFPNWRGGPATVKGGRRGRGI